LPPKFEIIFFFVVVAATRWRVAWRVGCLMRPLAGLFAFLLLAMTSRSKKPLVRLMEQKADAMGLSGWPLSHSVIDGIPSRSWPELLGCSSHEFIAELKKIATRAAGLSIEGVFVTAMTLKRKGKELKFSTIGKALGDAQLVEGFVHGDLPVLYTDHLDSMMDAGRLRLLALLQNKQQPS
jgi:hypothetical protein